MYVHDNPGLGQGRGGDSISRLNSSYSSQQHPSTGSASSFALGQNLPGLVRAPHGYGKLTGQSFPSHHDWGDQSTATTIISQNSSPTPGGAAALLGKVSEVNPSLSQDSTPKTIAQRPHPSMSRHPLP